MAKRFKVVKLTHRETDPPGSSMEVVANSEGLVKITYKFPGEDTEVFEIGLSDIPTLIDMLQTTHDHLIEERNKKRRSIAMQKIIDYANSLDW